MGYYTDYSLHIHPKTGYVVPSLDQVAEYISEIDGHDSAATWECILRGGSEGVKWYDNEDTMRAMSKRWPKIVFELHGQGEEVSDRWVKYFLNGKSYEERAPVWKPPEFDETKLRGYI